MSTESPPDIDDWLVEPQMRESLTCAICLGLLTRPVNLSTCSHSFCHACLHTYICPPQSQHPTCPQCVTPLSAKLHSVLSTDDCISGYYNEQLRKLKVRCPHCHEWDGILGVDRANLTAHREECVQLRVPCAVGCGQSISRSRQVVHERDECTRRLVQCDRCKVSVRFDGIAQHHINERECAGRHLCALGCGELVLDSSLADHRKRHCSNRSEPCTTCHVLFEVRSMQTHLEDSQPSNHCAELHRQSLKSKAEIAHIYQMLSSWRNTTEVEPSKRERAAVNRLKNNLADRVESIVYIIQLMIQYPSKYVQLAGLQRLLRLMRGPSSMQAIFKVGGECRVIMIMNMFSADAELQERACELLLLLATDASSLERLAGMGVFEGITQAMKFCPEVEAVQAKACQLLHLFAQHAMYRDRIVRNDGYRRVHWAFVRHSDVEGVKEIALEVMTLLLSDAGLHKRPAIDAESEPAVKRVRV